MMKTAVLVMSATGFATFGLSLVACVLFAFMAFTGDKDDIGRIESTYLLFMSLMMTVPMCLGLMTVGFSFLVQQDANE